MADRLPRGFILMPFASDLEWLHQVIKEAGREAGVTVERADDIAAPGVVIEQVKEAVERAEVVVAVCTHQNANVFFEMGLAWRDHRPILVAAGTEDLPFDIRHFRTLLYGRDTPGEDRSSLCERLVEAMKAVLTEPRPLPRGAVLTSPPRSKEVARLAGRLSRWGKNHRFTIRNNGNVDLHDVTLEIPPEGRSLWIHSAELPIDVLRPGESVDLLASVSMGGGKSIFDVILRGRTLDDEPIEQPVKVSL
jgi:hypothetical protein